MEGRAILTAEVMNGVRKEARVATNKAEFFSAELSISESPACEVNSLPTTSWHNIQIFLSEI